MFLGPSPPHTPPLNRRNNHKPPPHATVSSSVRLLLRPSRHLPRSLLSPLPLVFSQTLVSRFSFPLTPRRRSTVASMSRPPPPPQRFANPQSLSDWLEPRLPSDSFAAWGVKPGTKNVHNLWLELSDGETSLADSTPPVRTVNVVTVRVIGTHGKILVESHQELSDGSVRERFRPLSEKMKPEETPDEAVFRAVEEELGSIFKGENDVGERVKILPGSYSRRVEERNSLSYPGLPARYALHSVDATVEGLPEEDFCTEEEEYGGDSTEESEETRAVGKAVTVKRHYGSGLVLVRFGPKNSKQHSFCRLYYSDFISYMNNQ
ncbi:RING-H2 zinc finger protein [Hirschfeldia incana]|nr:RING-H2 zinc finger protein [Hirschfeldia incana]